MFYDIGIYDYGCGVLHQLVCEKLKMYLPQTCALHSRHAKTLLARNEVIGWYFCSMQQIYEGGHGHCRVIEEAH